MVCIMKDCFLEIVSTFFDFDVIFSSICLDFVRSGRFCVLHDSYRFPAVPHSHPYPVTCLQNGKGFGLPVKIVLLFPLL